MSNSIKRDSVDRIIDAQISEINRELRRAKNVRRVRSAARQIKR